VGDNPAKDFVNLNEMGATTIRLLTGSHASVIAKPGHDATHTIKSLSGLSDLLRPLQ
jgi:putative hydrolase of the HAD superfamily